MKSDSALPARLIGAGTRPLAAATPGVRRVRRPTQPGGAEFDLAYVRTGPRSRTPTLIIPGGPGLGSILPYRQLRQDAAAAGLDVIMVEHRGVGLSRQDLSGRDLPRSAMWVKHVIADIAAVLDEEGVDQVYVAGSSYGSYLASSFAATHPQRVAGMLLDSALQSAEDMELERQWLRGTLWEGDAPAARAGRALTARGEDERVLLGVARGAWELGGAALTEAVLTQRLTSAWTPAWQALAAYTVRDPSMVTVHGYFEFARAGTIGFRELGYGAETDGLPFDAALTYQPLAAHYPRFVGEPFDLAAHTPHFDWPLVLLAGSRDLRTPPPIAERTADLAPQATLVSLDSGHSALDTHPAAFVRALEALVAGQPGELLRRERELSELPRKGAGAALARFAQAASKVRAGKPRP